jgi:N-acetylmuramoyl-L-alanine amidase
MKADLFFSIHADAWKTERPEGACAFVYREGSRAHKIAHSILPALQEGIGSRGNVRIANFYVLRKTNMPAILLEIGFVTNPDDALWLMKHYKEQARRVAEALADGGIT